ncbi:OsmC family protein [Psychrobacter sp. DM4]|uniref:OsmC family protein n=1 Tax=Psychrobacter sp. DM4 TaxID=3440637 RepID=UPI003F4F7910
MSESKASVTWQEKKAFVGVSPSGHNVKIDADKEKGASPMELILLGLGGCASYDVVSILQKSRQEVTDVRCELTAQRAETVPAVYTAIHMHFVITGNDVSDKQIERAIKLSAEKYCSASRMLMQGGVDITHDFENIAG